jgi:hypothetical protein
VKMIKDHTKLGISFPELGALLGTRELLARKVVFDAKGRQYAGRDEHAFNMRVACKVQGCGSVACIGGTMAQIMGMKPTEANDYVNNYVSNAHDARIMRSDILSELFFPSSKYQRIPCAGAWWDDITPAIAVKAIDYLLAHGKVNWDKVMPKKLRAKIKRLYG